MVSLFFTELPFMTSSHTEPELMTTIHTESTTEEPTESSESTEPTKEGGRQIESRGGPCKKGNAYFIANK